MIASVIEELAEEYNDITFIDVNTDKYSELASKYSVRSIPSIFTILNGEILDNTLGANKVGYVNALDDLKNA